MKWNSIFDFINRQQPKKGYTLGLLDSATKWWDTHLSLGRKFSAWAIQYYPSSEQGKTREWVSEFYATSALLVAAVGLVAAQPVTLSWAAVLTLFTVAWPIYRSLELLSLLIGWIFIHTAKLHTVQRSLFGFLLNIAELSCLFTALEISIGGKPICSKVEAFVDGMVDLVTLSHHSPISFSVGGILEAIRIFFGVLIVLVVVGSLAGGVVRRTLADNKP